MKSKDFTLATANPVNNDRVTGTHPISKFGVNIAPGTHNNVDHCDCWEGHGCQDDTYTDTTTLYVNAKLGMKLCVSGAIAYIICEGSSVIDKWVIEHVMSYMLASNIPHYVCLTLGRMLLWQVWEEVQGIPCPVPNHGTTNLVQRMNIGVTGVNAKLYIFEMLGSSDNAIRHNRDVNGTSVLSCLVVFPTHKGTSIT